MVTRHYKCTNCEFEQEMAQSIHDEYLTICPECNAQVQQIYYAVETCVRAEPKTIGLWADRQNTAMGRQAYEEKLHNAKQEQADKVAKKQGKEKGIVDEKPFIPFWRKTAKVDTSLAYMTPEKMKHYAETGEKK